MVHGLSDNSSVLKSTVYLNLSNITLIYYKRWFLSITYILLNTTDQTPSTTQTILLIYIRGNSSSHDPNGKVYQRIRRFSSVT